MKLEALAESLHHFKLSKLRERKTIHVLGTRFLKFACIRTFQYHNLFWKKESEIDGVNFLENFNPRSSHSIDDFLQKEK